jgi:parallel beta-helix repeat protein
MTTPSNVYYSSYAIGLSGNNTAIVVDNTITGEYSMAAIYIELDNGSPVIERNLITNSMEQLASRMAPGIRVQRSGNAQIQHNTITRNRVGIFMFDDRSSGLTIAYNNIVENSEYNIYLTRHTTPSDVEASNNWWGSTDKTVIEKSIYDYRHDFDLGKVNYTPFLREPNSQAMPDPNAPVPTPISTANPSDTPSASSNPPDSATDAPPTDPNSSVVGDGGLLDFDWVGVTIVVLLAAIVLLLTIIAVKLGKRHN